MCNHEKYGNNWTLRRACESGNLEITKWLEQTFPNINVRDDDSFYHACKNGHLETAEWLVKFIFLGGSSSHFQIACNYGCLAIAKQMLISNPYLKKQKWECNYGVFYGACQNGHLETAKWLIQIFPEIIDRIDYNKVFRNACAAGHLEMIKWLKQIYPEIDIRNNSDYTFRWAYQNGFKWACQNGFQYGKQNRYFETIRWLATVCPNYLIIQRLGLPYMFYEIKIIN